MDNSESEIKVRNMKICDFSACFAIDQQIRASGKVTTYASITAKDVFDNSKDIQHSAFPISYVDFISRDMSAQVELGLVAEVEGEVRGFLLGRVVHAGEVPTEVGEISILGVVPDYQRRGIATELVKAIFKRFEDKGIGTVRIHIDPRDKKLLGLFKRLGFKAWYLLEYHKPVKNASQELNSVS